MIPKVIHYCWFGGNPLPQLAVRCMESWTKFCPDYEIKRWDESNFDVNCCDYVREACEAKKWAFVSDYVRLYVLTQYGGIYMDTDVEVTKPLDEFLTLKAFSGFENRKRVPTGIMGSERGFTFFKSLLNDYHDRHFLLPDGTYDLTTNVTFISNVCNKAGLIPNNTLQTVNGFTLYPTDWFCPKRKGLIHATENTHTIHHFDGSWLSNEDKKHRQDFERLYKKYGKAGHILYIIRKYALHPKNLVERIRRIEI